MTDEEKIEEYKHQIDLLKKEQENIDSEQKRLRSKWCELNQEIYKLEKNISTIEIDTFREECERGLHKVVKYSDIPKGLWWEKTKIFERISGGCKGDWYDGCRGCDEHCERRATEEFMKKYNIEEIIY